MQQTLKIEINKEAIISKPFDFEAMCLINDVHNSGEPKGYMSMCREAVTYLFEGTKATEDVLRKLPPAKMAALCGKIWGFYASAIEESAKNE